MKILFKEVDTVLHVPIYEVEILIYHGTEVVAKRKSLEHKFGPGPVDDYDALCSFSGPRFALFFKKGLLQWDILAHEIFHLTHRILNWSGQDFDINNHETFALLHGWLFDQIRSLLSLDETSPAIPVS